MKSYPLTFNAFKDALKEGKLLGLRCMDCNAKTAPPNAVCTSCGSPTLKIEELVPKGTIKTFTVIRIAPTGFEPPYFVALVGLEDGPSVLGNIIDLDPDQADLSLIGRKVSVGHKLFPAPENRQGIEGVALTFKLTS